MPQVYRALARGFTKGKWRISRDDLVAIVTGPERGKTGKVLEVFKDPKLPQVVVEGCNLRKKKVRTGVNDDDFFVVTMEAPLHYSQVQVLDPKTGRPARVQYMYAPDGARVRVVKKPNPTLADVLPEPVEDLSDPRAGLVGTKDTPYSTATTATFDPTKGFPFSAHVLEQLWAKTQRRRLQGPTLASSQQAP